MYVYIDIYVYLYIYIYIYIYMCVHVGWRVQGLLPSLGAAPQSLSSVQQLGVRLWLKGSKCEVSSFCDKTHGIKAGM